MADKKIFDKKSLLYICFVMLAISILLEKLEVDSELSSDYVVSYESVNIKNMTQPRIANKSIIENKHTEETLGPVEAISLDIVPESANQQKQDNIIEKEKKNYWYLPTETGIISQYPNYGHVAYDITSWRGYGEPIYPVAAGTISGIYSDSFGALIVTIRHDIEGKVYTSQYVHLSSYADGLYIGKEVSENDLIGQMGSTGYSTGPHLHITVLDCDLFNPEDPYCPNLDSWYQYASRRYTENFYGLGVLVNVPYSWNNR